jgi:hypothetical protein
MSIVGHVPIVSKYIKHVFRVAKCDDSDSGVKIKNINFYLTLSQPC